LEISYCDNNGGIVIIGDHMRLVIIIKGYVDRLIYDKGDICAVPLGVHSIVFTPGAIQRNFIPRAFFYPDRFPG